jgi:hypothetical protein
MDESRIFSNFGVMTSSFNTDNVPEPKKYFGGQQEFPIEVYEVYQIEYNSS